jgi:hypothetical protein
MPPKMEQPNRAPGLPWARSEGRVFRTAPFSGRIAPGFRRHMTPATLPPYASILDDPPRLRLRIRVQPRASRGRIAGLHGDAVKVQVGAPAIDGAANAALIALLADLLAVRQRDVALVSGERHRSKLVEVSTADPKTALRRIEAALSAR